MSLFAKNRAFLLFFLMFCRHLTYLYSYFAAEIDVKANALTKRGFEWNAPVSYECADYRNCCRKSLKIISTSCLF